MKRFATLTVAAVLALAGPVHAQQDQPGEKMPDHVDQKDTGTTPPGMGSTGWTGGIGGVHIGTSNELTTQKSTTSASAADQPLMATGADLKGPPTRFPANKTPE